MSITRDRKLIIFECDTCHEVLETETEDFDEALAMLRTEEWKMAKKRHGWEHYCSEECKEEKE